MTESTGGPRRLPAASEVSGLLRAILSRWQTKVDPAVGTNNRVKRVEQDGRSKSSSACWS
jgi:hypothetical protein